MPTLSTPSGPTAKSHESAVAGECRSSKSNMAFQLDLKQGTGGGHGGEHLLIHGGPHPALLALILRLIPTG